MIDGDKTPSELLAPRYDLTDSELGILEQELVDVVKSSAEGSNNLSAVWLSPHSSYADIIRTQEAFYWPTMEEIMEPHEDRSLFLALVDTREGRDEVVHGFRISGGGVLDGQEPHETPTDESPASMTGIVLIDDIINSGQGLTTQEAVFYQFFEFT